MSSVWRVLVWLLVAVVLGVLSWGWTLYQGWPWWWTAPLSLAGIGLLMAGLHGRRAWLSWRARRQFAPTLPKTESRQPVALDRQWRQGLKRLRASRLGRFGSPLCAQPWFLMLGPTGSGKTSLLKYTRLATSLLPSDGTEQALPTSVLDWWFFKRSVVLDLAGQISASAGEPLEWRRLLRALSRVRRKEPLNGVVWVLNVEDLAKASREQLSEQGLLMRQSTDELADRLAARIPVYLVLSGCDAVPGFIEWARALDTPRQEEPFGLFCREGDGEGGARRFLDEIFEGLSRRLFEVQLSLGIKRLPQGPALLLAPRVMELREPLEKLLLPFFDNHPYSETPLFGGLFLTAQTPEKEGLKGWFSRELFDRLLPARRYGFRAVERTHRRFARVAVALWLLLCLGAGGVMVYAREDARGLMTELSRASAPRLDVLSTQDRDIQALHDVRQTIERLDRQQAHWSRGLLPFQGHLRDVADHYRQLYVQAFAGRVVFDRLDPLLSARLQGLATDDDPLLVAAYVQHVVRRINLLGAQLQGVSLDQQPLPGPEWALLYKGKAPGARQLIVLPVEGLDLLYERYVRWQPQHELLLDERDRLLRQLAGLNLEQRSTDWLTAWAQMQGTIKPLGTEDFWSRKTSASVRLPAAFTLEGHAAIQQFLGELVGVGGTDTRWQRLALMLAARHHDDAVSGWYGFIQDFLLAARSRLHNEAQWRRALAVAASAEDPFQQMLALLAERFAVSGAEPRPPWLERAIQLQRLLSISREAARSDKSALRTLMVTQEMGGEVIHKMLGGQGVRHSTEHLRSDLDAARDLADYQRLLRGVIGELLKSDARALKIAMDTWSYGIDPQVESADLWQAHHLLDSLRLRLTQGDAREQVVWDLAGGALDFTLAYLGQSSACRLQQDWAAQVLSEVQGTDDPRQRHERLFGQQGVIPEFLKGPAKAFVERDATHYRAREVLGQTIALQAPFLTFISGMQKARAAMEQQVRDSQSANQAREHQRRELEAEQALLQAQLADLQPRLLLLRASTATVDLSVTPVQLNLGARQLPRRTRLTLQCSVRTTTLENFNFPTQASFAWAPDVCGDVELEVEFEYFSLHKRWLGERGFITFLRTFSVGRFTFTPQDFPTQRDLVEGAGIEWLQLTYRQQGERELLAHYAEVERLENRVSDANLRLHSLRERIALEQRAQGSAAVRSRAVTALPTLKVPTRIADCWTGSRGAVVPHSVMAEG